MWGRGFLAARKVRFLHASIRFMLLNADKLPHRPAEAHHEGAGAKHGPSGQRDYLRQHGVEWRPSGGAGEGTDDGAA